MRTNRIARVFLLAVLAASLCACGSKQWEIVAENKSETVCTIDIVTRGQGNASVDRLEKGKAHVLLAGDTVNVVIDAINVTRDGHPPFKHPGEIVASGERLRIEISDTAVSVKKEK